MRICYLLLSPTFGMHQYTADLANRMASLPAAITTGESHEIHLVTSDRFPRDRYDDTIIVHTPVSTRGTGFSLNGLQPRAVADVRRLVLGLRPDVVHITGPHLWNIAIMRDLSAAGVPVIHTLHDLDPHHGTRFAALLKLWNRLVISRSDHLLVHGLVYRDRLLAMGLPYDRVTHTPLLHLFLGSQAIRELPAIIDQVEYQPWALFFGRIERYKGLDCLLAACDMLGDSATGATRTVIAGPGKVHRMWAGSLPKGVELRNRLISDVEAVDLFRRCGFLVLPYNSATQSALIASAYYFRKPVLITRTGALPEYVEEGQTGCVVEAEHPATLARCLSEMLADPAELARMGAAGRNWYDSHRAAETQTLLTMYRRVLSSYVAGRARNQQAVLV